MFEKGQIVRSKATRCLFIIKSAPMLSHVWVTHADFPSNYLLRSDKLELIGNNYRAKEPNHV